MSEHSVIRGVICAGGNGTRLHPITKVTNKHLLPIYNKPMIYYAIEFLKSCGIHEILLVTGHEHAGRFTELLGDGSEFGVEMTYRVQEKAGGIAHAIGLAEHFSKGDNLMVILGDNVFILDPEEMAEMKDRSNRFKDEEGAFVFLKAVESPERFGVAELDNGKNIVNIIEKPKLPKSNYAVTGLYLFDNTIFGKIKTLKPSARGELELTDVNNMYLAEGKLRYALLRGGWTDAGTFESLLQASLLAKQMAEKKQG